MRLSLSIATLTLLASFVWSAPNAEAKRYNVSGEWRSSSGNIFNIPWSRTSFNIVIRYRRGGRELYRGTWIRRGLSFSYGGYSKRLRRRFKVKVYLDRRNSNRAIVQEFSFRRGRWFRRSTNYWTRVLRGYNGRYSRGAYGEWRSTSGNIFNIPRSRTNFTIVSRNRRGRRTLYSGRWLRGRTFRSFNYWNNRISCRAMFVSSSPNRLTVFCRHKRGRRWGRSKGPFYWYRVRR